MHRLSTSFVLGYHGCSQEIATSLVSGTPFKSSSNSYDWLGPGIYFWEANPRRGIEFFRELQKRSGKDPEDVDVVGAVIELGLCLDLASSTGVYTVVDAFSELKAIFNKSNAQMPENSKGTDNLLRNLDCAVIRYVHESRKQQALEPFDTVRGIFQEGGPAYENSGFFKKTHIQIAVCDPSKIKGVFRVKKSEWNEF